MPTPDAEVLAWAARRVAPGAEVTEVRGMRDGGSPWLIRLERAGTRHTAVLRIGKPGDHAPLRTEAAALALTESHGLPAPRLLAARLDADPPALLIEALSGSSSIPPDCPTARLRALGAAAAALHGIPLAPAADLPRREHPIGDVDFAALRRAAPPDPLLRAAEERAAQERPACLPGAADVFLHGDLWQGNALWIGDHLVGLIDWDCAGAGPAGVDVGSLRLDAALCFGPPAADAVQQGWEEAAGRPAPDVAYWDLVAALNTPPDMGWFVTAIAGQGRPDLDRRLLRERRDAFLRAALHRLDGER